MDSRIFETGAMGLRQDILRLPFNDRFQYDADLNTLFLNFEDLHLESHDTMNTSIDRIQAICEPLNHKV